MTSINYRGREIGVDDKGFLEHFGDWNEAVCEALAAADGLELDERRWCAIRFLRSYYEETGVPPTPHLVIREIGDKLAHFQCTHRNIEMLFPNGGCRQACRLAGLPGYYSFGC